MAAFVGHWKGVVTNQHGSARIEVAVSPDGSASYWYKGMRQISGHPRLAGRTLTIPLAAQDSISLTPSGDEMRYDYDGRLGQTSTTLTQN